MDSEFNILERPYRLMSVDELQKIRVWGQLLDWEIWPRVHTCGHDQLPLALVQLQILMRCRKVHLHLGH